MKQFKQYFNEANIPNWTSIISQNKELEAALGLMTEMERLGGTTLLVGGCVRDLLLGQSPKDIDIATNIPLDKIEARFKTYNVGQGKDFGVIVVPYNGFDFEVASMRKDIY